MLKNNFSKEIYHNPTIIAISGNKKKNFFIYTLAFSVIGVYIMKLFI